MRRYTLLFILFLCGVFLVTPYAQAQTISSFKINGCLFTASLIDAKGKALTKIKPNTPYKVKLEWMPGVGNCDSYSDSFVEFGWWKKVNKKFDLHSQFCPVKPKLNGNKMVVTSDFNTVDDPYIQKYVIPYISVDVDSCSDKSVDTQYFLKLELKVADDSSGNTNPNDQSTTPTADNAENKDEKLDVDTDVSIAGLKDYDEVVGTVFNPLNFSRPEGLLVWLINALLFAVGSLSVLFIIIGGIRMSTAAGNQSTFTKGKNTIQWAVIGLILSVLSFSIVAIIQSILT